MYDGREGVWDSHVALCSLMSTVPVRPSNPYTGVLAIFASRYLNGKEPLIFEDGYQKRDL